MPNRVMITGGGTGGHIFPAVSIAEELRRRNEKTEIHFVGAKGGMEMTLVPKAGFKIDGVWISGIHRRITLKNIIRNLQFPFKLLKSLAQAGKLIKKFKPDVVVGVGGYASGPVGRKAASRNIPLVICEQNAYPGITNKWLASKSKAILLGNEAASKYFDHPNVIVTGNPVRKKLLNGNKQEALKTFNFDPNKPVVLSLGGSLGARTLNEALEKNLQQFIDNDIQLIWQCGKFYHEELSKRVPQHPNIKLMAFIDNMGDAYAAADIVISRAGASTISELILLNKPAVMVPSPNVAEDHQTKNAMSLVDKGAALLVKDVEANEKLVPTVVEVLNQKEKIAALTDAMTKIEKHDAAKEIVDVIEKLLAK